MDRSSPSSELRVALVVGDRRTSHCGVKNYAEKLAAALGTIGVSAEVLAPPDWGFRSFVRFCQELIPREFDIVHLQYPSIGHRKSIGPHLLGIKGVAKRTVVTLHEYSALPFAQRASTHIFRWTTNFLIFTTDTESISYGRSSLRRQVIHIGSNIPVGEERSGETRPDVIYFGQIRPGKGIEQFLELARRGSELRLPYAYRIIGSVPTRRESYYKAIRADSPPEVDWLLDLPSDDVAQLMANSLAAYLPFPDGASYRKGSLLAALANGLPVITTVGDATSTGLLDVLLSASNIPEAMSHLEWLYKSPGAVSHLRRTGKIFSQRFCWDGIARQHEQAYRKTLSLA